MGQDRTNLQRGALSYGLVLNGASLWYIPKDLSLSDSKRYHGSCLLRVLSIRFVPGTETRIVLVTMYEKQNCHSVRAEL